MTIRLIYILTERSSPIYTRSQTEDPECTASDVAVHSARPEATGTHIGFSDSAVVVDPHGLNIGVPFSLCMYIGVGNSVT